MKIGLFGFGAVSLAIYNEMDGFNDIYALADGKYYERIKNNTYNINGKDFNIRVSNNLICDLVIVAVKNYSLESSINDLKKFIGPNTAILPLLNGIVAHDVLKSHFPSNDVLYGSIKVESNLLGFVLKCSKIIDIQYSYEDINDNNKLSEFKAILDSHNINNHICNDMPKPIWLKWMLNIGINQVSALLNATYLDMSKGELNQMIVNLFEEVYKVSLAYNIGIEKEDVDKLIAMTRSYNSNRVASLTMDLNYNDRNEIDTFSYELIKLAENKKIDVPYNKAIYLLLKGKENIKNK